MATYTEAATFFKELNRLKQLPQIIISKSSEPRVNDQIYEKLKNIGEKLMPGIEHISINGTDTDASVVHAELCTIPMFTPGRLIWLRHADVFFKKLEQDKTVLSYFLRDLPSLPENTTLLIQLDDARLPSKLSFIQDEALIYEEKKLKDRDLPAYVRNRAQVMGYEIEPAAIDKLVQKCAYDAKQAIAALDRLFTYTIIEKKISLNDVEEAVFDMEGDLYFKIIDSISYREVNSLLSIFSHHRVHEPAMLFGGISKLFSDTYRYMMLQKNGMSTKEIHKRLGLNVSRDFVMKMNNDRFSRILNNYSYKELTDAMHRLVQLDQRLKENTAESAQRTLFTMFFTSLSRP